ncbi:MAG TPA: class I SAM-dependent methyltransferase [Terriglobales bacterium]|nr:class I SAM-dependent methyltransferase [Terriglobales bacterium]
MPRVLRTVLPRIRRSFAERGLLTSLRRSVLLPFHLAKEYKIARNLPSSQERSQFDVTHGVDTDGDFSDWTYLSDLDISSPNWIQGHDYCPIEPERFAVILSGLDIRFEDFTFIDFGSGKGRALLLASDFPFRKIIGLEFSRELHASAERNIRIYPRKPKGCAVVESHCLDFLDYQLPTEPIVLFFFDPCADSVFIPLLENIRRSFQQNPRPLWLIYVAPEQKEKLLDSASFLVKAERNEQYQFCIYRSAGVP